MKQFLVRQKLRMDLGQWILPVVTLATAAIPAAKDISYYIHLPKGLIVGTIVSVALLVVWCFGYIMDMLGILQAYNRELNKRNEMLKEIHNFAGNQDK